MWSVRSCQCKRSWLDLSPRMDEEDFITCFRAPHRRPTSLAYILDSLVSRLAYEYWQRFAASWNGTRYVLPQSGLDRLQRWWSQRSAHRSRPRNADGLTPHNSQLAWLLSQEFLFQNESDFERHQIFKVSMFSGFFRMNVDRICRSSYSMLFDVICFFLPRLRVCWQMCELFSMVSSWGFSRPCYLHLWFICLDSWIRPKQTNRELSSKGFWCTVAGLRLVFAS